MKKLIATATLIALVDLLTGCASTGGTEYPIFAPGGPEDAVQASVFPELKLITTDGNSYTGKLTRLQGDTVTLRPYPYWNIPEVSIPLGGIHLIELTGSEGHAGSGFAAGFSAFFILTGGLGAATSKYNRDFQWAAVGSGLAGLIGGLVGLAVGAVGDATRLSKIKFYELPELQKRPAILKIMGRRAAPLKSAQGEQP
jgi:hypothetical protein